MQIPGVDWVVAAVLIAEIGVDMSVFVSVDHLAAWARVVPAITRAPAVKAFASGLPCGCQLDCPECLRTATVSAGIIAAPHIRHSNVEYMRDVGGQVRIPD
jgi:hypothetical protein